MRNTKAERGLHGCLFTGYKQCNGRHDCNRYRFLQASPDQSHPVTHSSDVGEMDVTAEHILSIPVKNKQEKQNKTHQKPKPHALLLSVTQRRKPLQKIPVFPLLCIIHGVTSIIKLFNSQY